MAVARVDVMMPLHNEEATVFDSVRSVLDQDYENLGNVLLAVAPSDDNTESICAHLAESDPRIRVVTNTRTTASYGLNSALASSTAPFIARVDGHAIVPAHYLRRLMSAHADGDVAVVGPVLRTTGTGVIGRAIAAAMGSMFGVGDARFRTGGFSGPVDTVAFGIYNRAWLDRVGHFREELTRNQDDELHDRIRRAGGNIILTDDVTVEYRARGSLRALAMQYHGYGRWRIVSWRTFGQHLRFRHVVPGVFVGCAAAGILATPMTARPLFALALAYTPVIAGLALKGFRDSRNPWVGIAAPCAGMTMHLAYGTGFLRQLLGLSGRSVPQ